MAEYNGVTLEPLRMDLKIVTIKLNNLSSGGQVVRQHWHYPLNSAVSLCAPMLRTW